MEKKKHIAFWIAFPIGFVLLGALILFYFDMANGPMVWFILALVNLVALAVSSIVLINRKKRWRLIPWGAFLLVFGLCVTMAKPSTAVWPAVTHSQVVHTELTLKNGKVKGSLSEDGKVEVYAGVPYAKPPVGELRWKPPVDCPSWNGVLDCTNFAPKSMQPGSNALTDSLVDLYAEKSWHPDYVMHPLQNKSEDSLYLNIWRPANIEGKLPILVYIHGGSLTTGSSAGSSINGETMAHQNVIMITIQYRLGVFGYFAHEDLLNEDPSRKTTGNYGLLDQIKALQWVQENADYFGGDKTAVTIAGESAGSSSVSALCVSPLAVGPGDTKLFRYAIGESSSLITPKPPHTFRTLEDALKVGKNIMKEQGCKTIAELRQVPAETLVETAYSNSGMCVDGYAFTEDPYVTYQKGNNHETALLNGYNVKEGDAFVVPQFLFSPTNSGNIRQRLLKDFDETTVDKIMDLYKDKIAADAFSAFNEIYSVYWFIQPHDYWSKMALSTGEPVYRYQFTKENGYYGTYHSGEIVYAYGNLARQSLPFAYDESDYALSRDMVSYWANFVKTGNPNGTGLATWDPYVAGGKVMELGENRGPIDDRYTALYSILDGFVNKPSAA